MKKSIFIFSILIFIFLSCSNNKEEKKESKKDEKKSELSDLSYNPKIKIEKINKLDVPNFVKIYVSRMEQEILWILKMRNTAKGKDLIESDQETGDNEFFIKEKKEFEDNFFKSWGITQKEFEEFANNNDEKISEYINKNQEIQSIIEEIQKINEKLYSPEEINEDIPIDNNNE